MEEETKLVRGLNLFDATTLVIGSMIGSGIFIVPSLMAGYIPSPGLILLLWVTGGVLTICGALSYAELAAAMPKAGGPYIYLKEIYSPLMGFLCGWTVFLVIQSGIIAAVAVAFAKYTGVFLPWISEGTVLLSLPHFTLNSAQFIGILSIWILTLINIYGLKSGAFVQNVFTVLKVACVLILVFCSFLFFKEGGLNHFSPFFSLKLAEQGIAIGLFGAIAVAMSKALFAYDPWYNVTYVAEEVENPQRNLPLSLFLGALATMAVYVAATVAYMYVVPINLMSRIPDNRIAADVAKTIFGNPGLSFIAAAVMISTFGCNNGLILGGARILYATARDGFFLKKAADVHPKFHTPVNALLFQAIWASILTITNSYSGLLTYVSFASLLFSSMAVFGIFIFRKNKPHVERPYKVWGYPVIPALYILISIFFIIFIFQGDPRNSLFGLGLIALGIPVYYHFIKKYQKITTLLPRNEYRKEECKNEN